MEAAWRTTRSAGAAVLAEVVEAAPTASRLLVAISARALSEFDDGLTLPQLRALVALDERGPVELHRRRRRAGRNHCRARARPPAGAPRPGIQPLTAFRTCTPASRSRTVA